MRQAAEMPRGERVARRVQAPPLALHAEKAGDQFRPIPFSAHPFSETVVREFAAAQRRQPPDDFVCAIREFAARPVYKNVLHGAGQPQNRVSGARRPPTCRFFQDGGHFLVRQAGHDRRDVHGNRDAARRQHFDGLEPASGPGRARLHGGHQIVPQGRDRQDHMDQIVARHLLQQVEVPGHEVVLGDDAHRIAVPQKYFEAPARQGQAAFERLVRVRIAGQGHHLRLPGFLLEGLRQQCGRALLDEDAGFEVEARRKAEVFVGRTGVTIHASVFAAPVRIQAIRKADIRAVVAGQQGFGGVHVIRRGRLAQFFLVQRSGVLLDAQGFEAVRGIDAGAPALPNG